jgi:hypothetical protein
MKTTASENFRKWMAGGHPMPEVVQALRVSAQSINNWRTGRQTPQFHHRQNIQRLTGSIEPRDWLAPAASATACVSE